MGPTLSSIRTRTGGSCKPGRFLETYKTPFILPFSFCTFHLWTMQEFASGEGLVQIDRRGLL